MSDTSEIDSIIMNFDGIDEGLAKLLNHEEDAHISLNEPGKVEEEPSQNARPSQSTMPSQNVMPSQNARPSQSVTFPKTPLISQNKNKCNSGCIIL